MSSTSPWISVVVPVHNGARTLSSCLRAIRDNDLPGVEIIVVDDRSTDTSAAIAFDVGARVVPNNRGQGPAAARNVGVEHSSADLILFVDSDVVIEPTTLSRIREIFERQPELAAVFGSYDNTPSEPNFMSQYKNLFHHYTHQQANENSTSFWAGCGAIRRDVFRAVGGFDEQQYPRASAEDIELGLRLWKKGYAIRLERTLQVKHLKRWTWTSLLRSDIVDRAYLWSKMLVRLETLPSDLNVRLTHRVSAAAVGLLVLVVPFLALGHQRFYGIPVMPAAIAAIVLLLCNVILLNRGFYGFLATHRGWPFMIAAIPLHMLYYFYSGVTFVFCWLDHRIRPEAMRAGPEDKKVRAS